MLATLSLHCPYIRNPMALAFGLGLLTLDNLQCLFRIRDVYAETEIALLLLDDPKQFPHKLIVVRERPRRIRSIDV